MDMFKEEYAKEKQEFNALGLKSQRRNLKYREHQIGSTDKDIDSKRKALLVGKRISKAGKIYYEYRKNRGDLRGSSI
jgi:hypothetical protein